MSNNFVSRNTLLFVAAAAFFSLALMLFCCYIPLIYKDRNIYRISPYREEEEKQEIEEYFVANPIQVIIV
mgnify:CR=1 FL=1|tara:strand:- start:612 stop:821 length:210 start_codon:yes stop_codon:yes gene_type:complete